jgi:hypothetical protein
MINYSIDTSIFTPPDIPTNNQYVPLNENNDFKYQIDKYNDKIKNVENLINTEGVSVYLFQFTKVIIDNEYITQVNRCGFPMDITKKKLQKIDSYYSPDPDSSNYPNGKKYHFVEDKLKIENLKCKSTSFVPIIQNKKNDISEVDDGFIKIGLLNYFVYNNDNFHFLIRGETKKYSIKCDKLSFTLNKSPQEIELINLNVNVLNIFDISCIKEPQFKTVLDAYKKAKEMFSDFIIFGNDIEKGINTIELDAGPPDRIFAYLQTLKEYSEFKINNKTDFTHDYFISALGCDCSFEKPEHMQNENVKNDRMFDNGNNEKAVFSLHLKPSTFPRYERTKTVRIYFLWDDTHKKVIVGWIGNHKFIPPKKPLSPKNSSHYIT